MEIHELTQKSLMSLQLFQGMSEPFEFRFGVSFLCDANILYRAKHVPKADRIPLPGKEIILK